MTATVRFAPSPTGQIHIGNARTALFNALFARQRSGSFVLRLDDTDVARSREEYALGIIRDLEWLGIAPDRIERQSTRFAFYDEAAEKLKQAGLLYPCFETPEELDRRRKRRRARGLPPIYDRSALKLSDEQKAALEAEGRKPHWRFLLPNFESDPFKTRRSEITWSDLCRGEQSVDLASLSDPVLLREDGTYLYTLPSIVDDIDFAMTHVIRGEDHVANTAVQIAIFHALGATPPVFGHHNLLTTASGEGLSKRSGALSISALREAGYEPMTVASLAVLIGSSDAVEPMASLDALTAQFDLAHVSRAPARFDPADLDALNARLLREMPADRIAGRLIEMGVPADKVSALWDTVSGNIEKVSDVEGWWRIVSSQIEPDIAAEDREFLEEAARHLPEEPWDGETWKSWTGALKAATGRKGKGLFMPLRKALTGLEHGPELARLLPLIGRRNTLDRLV
ncbi:glutamyl-tRNA synthetase /glutamate--tRNA(Gln) ligase [Breoghania corrubedonensis]|uniref:Glutamate--tRNA ligase n=1 Tax=Breoghania corrubedonensis TaxID=665038 RepID=A0A2T5VAZ5_9HYPH|nr:glutamate--tRNA ligase [Breoghania corrubedonensis]PTW60925.1 glutamyl-tRNA synthetase /glutamate--tRNA(Gln) ligase [Breoghania corrubedonensis]